MWTTSRARLEELSYGRLRLLGPEDSQRSDSLREVSDLPGASAATHEAPHGSGGQETQRIHRLYKAARQRSKESHGATEKNCGGACNA